MIILMTTPQKSSLPIKFNIAEKAGGVDVRVRKEWSDDEQQARLADYSEIPSKYWKNIRGGSHIRFYKTDGSYNNGGFIDKNPEEKVPLGGKLPKLFMILKTGFGHADARWTVAYEDLERVFVKNEALLLTLNDEISSSIIKINENILTLSDRIDKLNAKIEKIKK
jgi:hypothetical protein